MSSLCHEPSKLTVIQPSMSGSGSLRAAYSLLTVCFRMSLPLSTIMPTTLACFFFFLINRFCHWFDAKHSTDLTESCVSKPYPLQKKFLTIFTSDVPGKGNNSSNAQHSIEWDYQETFYRVGLYNSVRFNRNNTFDKLLFKDVSGWPVFWWNVFQQAPGE